MKRLIKVAKELNIGTSKVVDFLNEKGFKVENRPTAKISDEAYELLKNEYRDKNKTVSPQLKGTNPELKGLKTIGRIDFKKLKKTEKHDMTHDTSFQRRNNRNNYSRRGNRLISSMTLGEVVFFDYSTNKFGFIKNALYIGRKENEETINKIHVREENLITNNRLYEGKKVVFELFKGNRGYFAKNVKTLEECSLQDAEQLIEIVDESYKHILIKRILENDEASEKSKRNIKVELLKTRSVDNWVLLSNHFEDDVIKEYREKHFEDIENKELERYVNHTFNKDLFVHYLTRYEFDSHYSFLQILRKIASNLSFDELPKSFNEEIEKLEDKVSVDNALSYLEILNEKVFFDLAIFNFSFSNYGYKDHLKKITSSNFNSQLVFEKIVSKLFEEVNELSSDRVLTLYEDFNFIKDIEQLFTLLKKSKFNSSTFWSLIEVRKSDFSNEQIKTLYDKIKAGLSFEDLKRLIKKLKDEQELISILMSDLFSIEFSKKQLEDLFVFLLEEDTYHKFATEFARTHSEKYVNISNVSLITFLVKVDESQIKNILSKIEIRSKQEFVELKDFLFSRTEVFNRIQLYREENKGLVDFLVFFQAPSESLVTTDLNTYIAGNLGFLQVVLCKRIVHELFTKKINKNASIRIYDRIKWTEISAILIKAFINLSQTTQKIILDTLNLVFKSHFEILESNEVKPEQFLKTFTIKDIVNKCDCRKSYNGEFWQGGRVSRWYISGDTPSISYESKVTYRNNNEVVFCEGRFWKKGNFFNRDSNTSTQNGGDFYWCRGSYCAKVNDNCDLTQPYDEWTLSEIARVLNLSVDRLVFTTLAGWANRMNEIVERLVCRSCNEVLRPLPFTPRTLGYNAVPVFNCINQSCENHKMPIRFTHCLNGKCNNILDSRDCESCIPDNPNHIGMKCNECGSLCPKCSGTWNRIQVEY